MSVVSLAKRSFFRTFTKPVNREAEALVAGAAVFVLVWSVAQARDVPEYVDLPSDVSIEVPESAAQDADQHVPARQRY